MKLSKRTKTRIKMFTDRKIFKNEQEVIDAAMDLLMEHQLNKESLENTSVIDEDIMMAQFEAMNRIRD